MVYIGNLEKEIYTKGTSSIIQTGLKLPTMVSVSRRSESYERDQSLRLTCIVGSTMSVHSACLTDEIVVCLPITKPEMGLRRVSQLKTT